MVWVSVEFLSFIVDFHYLSSVVTLLTNFPLWRRLHGSFVCWVGYFGSTGLEFGLEFDLEWKLTFDLLLCESGGWEVVLS